MKRRRGWIDLLIISAPFGGRKRKKSIGYQQVEAGATRRLRKQEK